MNSKVYYSLAKLRNEGYGLKAATQIKMKAKHCVCDDEWGKSQASIIHILLASYLQFY